LEGSEISRFGALGDGEAGALEMMLGGRPGVRFGGEKSSGFSLNLPRLTPLDSAHVQSVVVFCLACLDPHSPSLDRC